MPDAGQFDQPPVQGPAASLRLRLCRRVCIESALIARLALRDRLGPVVSVLIAEIFLPQEDCDWRCKITAKLGVGFAAGVDAAHAIWRIGLEGGENVG